MSVKGKKVLHIDRNDHYGGFVPVPSQRNSDMLTDRREAASVNIEAVRVHVYEAHFLSLTLPSSSKDITITPKARNPGKNMVESMTGMSTSSLSSSCQMAS